MEKKTKTEALIKAKNALKAYLKEHNLNPIYDWREDKVHGREVTRLVTRLNLERDKVLDKYPYEDIPNETKLVKMKKAKEKALKEKKAAKAKEVKVEKTEKKVSASKKYDYPLIDGREMTTDEKKKYRAEQRRLQNKDAKPKKEKAPKAEKSAKKEKVKKADEAPKKEKKPKKEAVPEKPLKEKKVKKEKKAKSED